MHLLRAFTITAFAHQIIAIPLHPEPSRLLLPLGSLTALDVTNSALSARQSFRLLERGTPPPECADPAATEDQGCFTVRDGSKNVRFALAPGKTFQGEESLGAGVFGSVAQCVLEDGTDVAVKQYKSADSPGAERSFNTMKTLEGNEYIVKTYGFGTIQNKAALAMELAPDGTIQSRIERGDYKGKEKEQKMKEVGSKLLEGFTYMHSKSIAHRDIHNGNVVFKGDTPKVVDFDFACELTQCIKFVPGGNGGQAAPEALLPENWAEVGPKQIDAYANDVWTVTRMLLHMTTGEIPPSTSSTEMRAIWQVDNTDERTKAIKKQWPAFADEFVEMLADVFCRQGLRISMETLKNDFADVQIYC